MSANPKKWPLDKKLTYVRRRIAEQDKKGWHHPGKRLSLWPLSVDEALGVIFKAGNDKPKIEMTQEERAWLNGKSDLQSLRKHLRQPDSPTPGSRPARTSRE